jgi:glycosyltransferase involved in cell wall biosynthesis
MRCWDLRTPYVVHRHVGFVQHSSFVVGLVQRAVIGSIGRLVVRRAEAVLPIDEHVASDVRSAAPTARIEVLGNGVDTHAFRPLSSDERRTAREQLGLPADRPLVLFVGRFVPKKGFHHVSAAASDEYDVVLVGGDRPPGADDPRLHFLGGLPAGDMPRVYGCADVMVVASVGECPLTVLESMSSGLPLVANDDPALHSPWTAGPGVTFVDMAGGDLRTALEGLARDPEMLRKVGAEAQAFVRASFSWDAHLDRLEDVYTSVLSA